MGNQFPGTAPAPPSRRPWRFAWLRWAAASILLIVVGTLGYRAWYVSQAERAASGLARSLDEKDPGWRWEDIVAARRPVAPGLDTESLLTEASQHLPERWPLVPAASTTQKRSRLWKVDEAPSGRLLDEALSAELRAELIALRPAFEDVRKVIARPEWGHQVLEWERDPRKRLRSLQCAVTDGLTGLLEAPALPAEERTPKVLAWCASVKAREASLRLPEEGNDQSLMILASMRIITVCHLEAQMRLGCAILALAAERHRLKIGRWPEKINDLVPEFVKEAPRDFFAKEPLRMRRLEDGITFYSVGLDGADDGGNEVLAGAGKGDAGTDLAVRLFDPGRRRQPAPPPGPEPVDEEEE